MKFAISLLSMLILLQSTSIGVADVLRMTDLVEHAQYHKQEYGDSLFVFLSKHYGQLKKGHMGDHPHDSSDHSKLPFHHNGCVHMSFVAMIQDTNPAELHKIQPSLTKQDNFHYKEPASSLFTKGIFQPPKFA